MSTPTLTQLLLVAKQYERAEELERRAIQGSDDVAYCIKWAGIHRRMADAVTGRTTR